MIIIIGLGAGVAYLLWLSSWFHRDEELGSVSAQWLAEHRQNQES